jgi:hypothetical protein
MLVLLHFECRGSLCLEPVRKEASAQEQNEQLCDPFLYETGAKAERAR